eukprot:7273041-Pyramimonas_sp.AAC.1
MNSKMINQVLFAVVAAVLVSAAMATQTGPVESDEIHHIAFDPVKGNAIRNEQFGMRADEKAGLTIGFTVMGFFLFLLTGFVAQNYGKIQELSRQVEDLQQAANDAKEAAML